MGLSRKQIMMIVILIVGTFVAVLNQTVVTPALPSIMTEMSVDASTAQWLTTGFTLVNAIMIPVTAYLTDRYSTRRLFVSAMTIFSAGSLLAALAPNFALLLAGRLLQAAGAGILMPMVMTVILLTFPSEKRGSAMGIFGLIIAFAPAIGPTVAGIVIDQYSWRFMFGGIAALGLIVIICSLFFLDRQSTRNTDLTLDKLSVVLSTLGFGALLYGLSAIGSYGIGVQALLATLVGVVALIFFFRRQLSMKVPMLQVRVLQNRTFLIGTIIGMLVQAALLVAGILMPIYLQTLLGYSATVSGLVIMPGAIVMGAMGPIAGRWFDKYGPRALAIAGMSILTLTTFGFALLGSDSNIVYITVLYTVRLFSLSLVNMPITTWAMNSLDDKLVNHGNAVNNTFRQVAGSLGTAILVSVMSGVAAASQAGGADYLSANIIGIDTAFGVSGLFCLAGLVLTIIFVRSTNKQVAEADPDNAHRSVLESIMQRDVYTLSSNSTAVDAMKLMVDKGISAAPIVDEKGDAIGFISDGDILRHLSKRNAVFMDPVVMIMQMSEDKEAFDDKLNDLKTVKARDIGAKGIIGVSVHANLQDVCHVLGEHHLKKVPVLDDNKVVGVINRSDITQYSMKAYLEAPAS